jgi:hypothetical protein
MIAITNLSDITKHTEYLVNDNFYFYEGLVFLVRDCKVHVVEMFPSMGYLMDTIENVIKNNSMSDPDGPAFVAFATWNMEAINAFHNFTKDLYIDPNDPSDDY